jgi:hypothetical protein
MHDHHSMRRSTAPDSIEAEFAETLRGAAFIFEKVESGRFQGSILACQAVARFIHQRGGGAELAAPFLQIAEAFKELERGGKPRLFSKRSTPAKQRERSPERKHIQMLAAAALEVLVRLTPRSASAWGDGAKGRDNAASKVARYVNKWPGMEAQQVTGKTIIAWRNQQRALNTADRKRFDTVVEKILAEPSPEQTVVDLLRRGPPGFWKS